MNTILLIIVLSYTNVQGLDVVLKQTVGKIDNTTCQAMAETFALTVKDFNDRIYVASLGGRFRSLHWECKDASQFSL